MHILPAVPATVFVSIRKESEHFGNTFLELCRRHLGFLRGRQVDVFQKNQTSVTGLYW